MNQQHALELLGLGEGASTIDIGSASKAKKADIEDKIAAAPTDALKAKFQTMLDKVCEAEQVLSQPKKTKSRSPLSETKMADLPGMAPAGASADELLKAGDTLSNGRYAIKEQIGEGGMGAVYRAADNSMGKDIALKVLLPALAKHDRAKERFLDEARISQQLSHPNIANVYDVQQDGGFYFLTMELLEGQDLRQVIENHKLARQTFTIKEVQEIISAVSDGLSYAHQHTVHRDIKPENIWLTEDGEYKLMDFGIAQVQSTSQRTQTGAAMGTAYYMAPEQLKGAKDVDGRADQYALGVLAYELLAGDVPAGMVEPVQQLRKDVPKSMANAIHQDLAPKPENRFEDINLFSEALNKKGNSMPSLPFKTIGIAVAVILSLGLVGSLISSGGLDGLLPESAEALAIQKAEVAKLQGEIKTYKRRLENGRRQLDSNLREAKRDNARKVKNLDNWQTVTENYIFKGSALIELEGKLSQAESLLQEKAYKKAKASMLAVRDNYKALWDNFNAAEKLQAAEKTTLQAFKKWTKRQKAYQLNDPVEVTQAKQNETKAKTQQRDGEFLKALLQWQQAEQSWQSAYTAVAQQVNNINQKRNKKAAASAAKATQLRRKQAAAAKAQAAQLHRKQALAYKARLAKNFVYISGGRFKMGSNAKDLRERSPIHSVTLKPFAISKYEVTHNQWRNIMGNSQSYNKNCGNCPVEKVNWNDVQNYISKLNAITGKRFRLPSEAEWEYACRSGGKKQEYCGGSNTANVGWYNGNSKGKTHPVGQKQPNGFGLYDMSGNISELTQDCWNKNYNGAPSNGKAWLSGDCDKRVLRGSFWGRPAPDLRSSRRSWGTATSRYIYSGFRLAQD